MVQHRHERPGSCGYHSLMTTTDARACRAIIADPPCPGPTHPRRPPLQHAETPSLLAYLATIPDPRTLRGRRHPLIAILAMAAAAVLGGARSVTAIAEWAADAPQPVRAALGARRDAPDHWSVPAEATIRRTLGRRTPRPGHSNRRLAGRPGPCWPAAACPGGGRQDTQGRQTRWPPGPPAGRDGPRQPRGPGPTPGRRRPWRGPRLAATAGLPGP